MATPALAAAASPQPQPPPCMEQLEAAQALLGVSPARKTRSEASSADSPPSSPAPSEGHRAGADGNDATTTAPSGGGSRPRSGSYDASLVSLVASNKSRSSGGALDALAALATSASAIPPYSSSSRCADRGVGAAMAAAAARDDSSSSAIMPPPPPRSDEDARGAGGRLRSASNPEGMEKWDSLGGPRAGAGATSRRHFVLPSSILEEELADANLACANSSRSSSPADVVMSDAGAAPAPPSLSSSSSSSSGPSSSRGLPLKKRMQKQQQQHHHHPTDVFGTSPDSVMMVIEEEPAAAEEPLAAEQLAPEEDESDLEPAELLRRARARLLEDLSTEGAMGEKGVLPLPHSLAKYKEVYNKNGRIGIYTPAERAAIIAKFNSKRSRRVWNKKIRYNCRKNLADRRMRVKGRFVKRSTEQAAQLKVQLERQAEEAAAAANLTEGKTAAASPEPLDHADDDRTSASSSSSSSSRASSPDPADPPPESAAAHKSTVTFAGTGGSPKDEEMPDVDDPDAGFEPKKGQPYRRTRRHTIT